MSVFAIVAALVVEQWRPLGERRMFVAVLARWAIWLERTFNAGEPRNGAVAWLVAVVPAVLAAYLVHAILAGASFLETARIVASGKALQIDRDPLFDLLADRMDLLQGVFSAVFHHESGSPVGS